MRLTAPLGSIKEVAPLVEAGADELYCGVKEPDTGSVYLSNFMSEAAPANLASFKALSEAVTLAGSRGVPLVFCANSSQGRHTLVRQKRDIRRAYEAGIRRVVVADLAMIPWIKRELPDLYVVLSTLCPVFNQESLAFFARLGIDRIVLDSVRTLGEIARTAEQCRRLGIDLEVFTTPQDCFNIRASCNFHTWFLFNILRTDDMATWSSLSDRIMPCHRELPVSVYEKRGSGWTSIGPARRCPPRGFVGPNCVLCALWHLHGWGVPFIKICGRPNPLEEKLLYVRLAKMYLRGIEDGSMTSKNFFRKGKELYKQLMGCGCGRKRCFYPEIRSTRDHGASLAK